MQIYFCRHIYFKSHILINQQAPNLAVMYIEKIIKNGEWCLMYFSRILQEDKKTMCNNSCPFFFLSFMSMYVS